MLDFLENTGIVEFLYNWNAVVIISIGLLIDLILGLSNRKKSKLIISVIILIAIVAICISFLVVLVQRYYTYVPENFWDGIPFGQAQSKLIDCGLQCPDENILWDESAREKIISGISPNNVSFRVKTISPESGTFLRKNSEVKIEVVWRPFVLASNNDLEIDKTAQQKIPSINIVQQDLPSQSLINDGEKPYPGINPADLLPLNTDEFSLTVEERALKMITDGGEEWSLGTRPETNTPMQVYLIDYFSGEVIDSKLAYIGDSVHFSEIPDGVYYYIVESQGYSSYISESPFSLKFDKAKEKAILPWIIFIEPENIHYQPSFKVQMIQPHGNIAPNEETIISIIDKNSNMGSSYSAYINENGFLTLWMGINDVDYYLVVDFYVVDGYTLVVYDHNNSIVEAHANNSEVCVLEY